MIPILPNQPINFVTVQQMYEKTKAGNIPLLSDYTAEFWSEYLQNFARYDRVFNRLYRGFYYFNQDANSTAQLVQPEFTEDVYGLLLMNQKKYSELYRIHVVNDNTYSMLDNYDVTETREGETARTITDSYGQKIQNTLGSNDLTDVYGQKIDSLQESKDLTDVYGQKVTTGENLTGSQNNTAVDKVAPYNSENFSNENRNETSLGQRSDSSTTTENTYTDTHDTTTTSTNTRSSYTDTHNTDIDNTVTQSAYEDTHEHEGTDSYTLRRKGIIGGHTQTEVMDKHANFWKGFNFYKIIFADICKELLLIDRGYI